MMKKQSYLFLSLIIFIAVILTTVINSSGLNTIEKFSRLIDSQAAITTIVTTTTLTTPSAHSVQFDKFTNKNGSPGFQSYYASPASLLQPEQSRMDYINVDYSQEMQQPLVTSTPMQSPQKLKNTMNTSLNENSMYASAVDFFAPSSA
jgi:hypothetical protein